MLVGWRFRCDELRKLPTKLGQLCQMPWTGQFGHLKWCAVGQVVQWFCRVVAVVCRTCLRTCPTWVYTYQFAIFGMQKRFADY